MNNCNFEIISNLLFENKNNIKENDYIIIMKNLQQIYNTKVKPVLNICPKEKICPNCLNEFTDWETDSDSDNDNFIL